MVVLITGCRSGFGLLTAVHAARQGHTVYAGLRDLETSGELMEAARGLAVHPIQLDVTSADERRDAVATILSKEGRIDALVNNAGVALGGFLERLRGAHRSRFLRRDGHRRREGELEEHCE